MKCPLTYSPRYFWHAVTSHEAAECLKEECVWWERTHQVCVISSIDLGLRLLVGAVAMLADKMPPARKH